MDDNKCDCGKPVEPSPTGGYGGPCEDCIRELDQAVRRDCESGKTPCLLHPRRPE